MNRSELIDVISDALGEADPGAILDAIQAAGWAVVPKENAVKSREFQEVAALVCDDVDTAAKSSAEAQSLDDMRELFRWLVAAKERWTTKAKDREEAFRFRQFTVAASPAEKETG